MEGGEELGPVVVPKKITELAEKDFFVYLELGKKMMILIYLFDNIKNRGVKILHLWKEK
ncbi:MAG: hypothetical protein ACOC2I_04025 [Halanaerobium sp.]